MVTRPTTLTKFWTIGDLHINMSGTLSRLEKIRDKVNASDANFVVILGDLTNDATASQFQQAKSVTDTFTKKLFVVIGNHDALNTKLFIKNYGPTKHIEHINGWQLLFIGLKCTGCTIGGKLSWDFDFNTKTNPTLDKNLPTLVFIHGTVSKYHTTCPWGKYYGYPTFDPYDIKNELGKFSNIRAIYNGHWHFETQMVIDIGLSKGIHCIQNASITNIDVCKSNPSANVPTNFEGYTVIDDTTFNYQLVDYTTPILTNNANNDAIDFINN
jgi:hypothetical protein